MEYTARRPFSGDPERAFDLITGVFTTNNYKVASRDAWTLRLEETGDSGKRSRGLLGASRVGFSIEGGNISMQAEMDGIRKLSIALVFLPLGLGVFLLVLFSSLFSEMGSRFIAIVSLGPVLPWVLASPLLIRWLRKRSQEALESLVDSIVTGSER